MLLLHAAHAAPSSSSAWAPPAAPGAACGLLVFDGTNASDVTLPEPAEPINAAGAGITLSVWVLQTVTPDQQWFTPLVDFTNGPGLEGFSITFDDDPWWDVDVSCCIPMVYYVFDDQGYAGGVFPPSAETGPGSFSQKQWVRGTRRLALAPSRTPPRAPCPRTPSLAHHHPPHTQHADAGACGLGARS